MTTAKNGTQSISGLDQAPYKLGGWDRDNGSYAASADGRIPGMACARVQNSQAQCN